MSEQSGHAGPGRLFAVRETQCPAVQYIWLLKSASADPISVCPTISNLSPATARGSMTSAHHVSRQHQDGILWHNAHMHSRKKEVNADILDLLAKMRVIKANSPCAVPGGCVQNGWNIQALHEPSFPQLQNNPLQTPPPMIQRPDKHTGGILVLYHRPGECTSPGEHPRRIQTPDSLYHSFYKWIYLLFGLSSGPAMFQRCMEDPLYAHPLFGEYTALCKILPGKCGWIKTGPDGSPMTWHQTPAQQVWTIQERGAICWEASLGEDWSQSSCSCPRIKRENSKLCRQCL